jgi:hypothetical protein
MLLAAKNPALKKLCAPVHCNGGSTSPGSTVVPGVFGGPARSGVAESYGNNVRKLFCL